MPDNRITITFNNFNDFKEFLVNPGTVRLNQITGGKLGYNEEPHPQPTMLPKEPRPIVNNNIYPAQHVPSEPTVESPTRKPKRQQILDAKRFRRAVTEIVTHHVATHAGPISAFDLIRKALSKAGRRATQRNVKVASTAIIRMVNIGQLKRPSRGFYTTVTSNSSTMVKKTSAKVKTKK